MRVPPRPLNESAPLLAVEIERPRTAGVGGTQNAEPEVRVAGVVRPRRWQRELRSLPDLCCPAGWRSRRSRAWLDRRSPESRSRCWPCCWRHSSISRFRSALRRCRPCCRSGPRDRWRWRSRVLPPGDSPACRCRWHPRPAAWGPAAIHEPDESEVCPEHPECRSTLRAQLQLRLIGPATKFGRRLPANQASTEEPFVALFDVVGIWRLIQDYQALFASRLVLVRSKRLPGNIRMSTSTRKEERQRRWHDETHLPVSEVDMGEAMQKRRGRRLLAHFGKNRLRRPCTTTQRWACTICFSSIGRRSMPAATKG